MTRISRIGDTPACRGRCHAGAQRPPSVAADRQLCAGCRDRVEEDLVELSELYELCTYTLELRDPGQGKRGGAGCPQGLGLAHPVAAIQSDVLRVLASWSGVVAGERGVTAPDEHSVRRLTAFLAIHLDWLTDHPLAAEFADALDELASAIREALRPGDQYRSLSRNEK